jgi:polar amino acid transport system substrate-binding protein
MMEPMMKRVLAALLLCLPTSIVHAELPAALVQKGSITFANVPNYPPLEFRDPASGALTGFDIDLGNAIAARLGVKAVWQETSFDQMLAALQTGRVDAIISGMSDIATRHDAAGFVDYLHTAPQFFIQQSRAGELKEATALCGRKVGASRRTQFPKNIAARSDANCPAGNPIIFVGTEGSADARTQLKQGRIDAAVQGNETLPWIMGEEPGVYQTLGVPFAGSINGIGLPTKEAGLQQAIAGALDAMIADGSYAKLLAKWKLTPNAIEKATINAGQ